MRLAPTEAWVQERISEYNRLIFNSELPPVPVVITRANSYLGKLCYVRKRSLFGSSSATDFVMRISSACELSEREREDVIIHELIHYYIAYKGIKDTSIHGQVFRSMMNDINSRYGRHIEVSHKLSGVHRPRRQASGGVRIVCISELSDGRMGVTVCARSRVYELRSKLPRYYGVRKMEWYMTDDSYFDRYPRSISPKIYRISPEEIQAHLFDYLKITL